MNQNKIKLVAFSFILGFVFLNHGTTLVVEKPSRETKLLKSFQFVNLLHLKPSPSL